MNYGFSGDKGEDYSFVAKAVTYVGNCGENCKWTLNLKLETLTIDGSGNLGTIMDGNNIVGQAHWIKADSQVMTTTIPYNPTVLFMAMALMSIDKKLDKIQETQKEILRFLELDKEF